MPSALLADPPKVIRPAFLWTPPSATHSLVDEVAELAEDLGQEVREEERIALAALTPMGADGLPAGLEGCIICGRQQLKSWAIEMCTIHDGWERRVGRIMWSAHQVKTSDDNFEHLTELIAAYDWLSKRVSRVYGGNGNHKIVFADKLTTYPTLGDSRAGRQQQARTIEFGARENGPTGRGRVKVNRLVFDEWLFGTPAMAGAQIPTMGTVHDAYVRYGSSPGKLKSVALRTLRERGRRGGDPSLSYVEWTSERLDHDGKRVQPSCADRDCSHLVGLVDGCFLDDREVIRLANPAYGTSRLSAEFVGNERRTLTPEEFARERAGIWEDPPEVTEAEALFPKWSSCVVPTGGPVPGATVALGVDTAWSGSVTWVASAVAVPGGPVRVELVASMPDADRFRDWLLAMGPEGELPRLVRLRPAAVALQASGAPVSSLLDQLKLTAAKSVARGLSGADLAKGCGRLWSLVDAGAIEVVKHPKLERAAAGAVGRPMADAWVVDRKASRVDVAPLIAVVAAVWALLTTGDDPDEDYDVMDSVG